MALVNVAKGTNMSMNLMCDELELYQTPTHITYMCLVNKSGLVRPKVTGNKAKRALQMYLRWVQSTIDGVWEDAGALQSARDALDDHVAEVEDTIIGKGKDLVVYYI